MINEKYAKRYCCEDLSLIENYDLAINDTTQIWDCHHILGEKFSRKYLIDNNLYKNRPACELRFLTTADHISLHHKGVPLSEAAKKAMSDAHKGVPLSEEQKQAISDAKKDVQLSEAHKQALSDAMKGVPLSELHKRAISDAKKGVPLSEATKQVISDALKGVPLSEAHKQAISDALKGVPKGPMSEAHKRAISEAHSKKILQYTKSGEFIREWPSAKEAQRELGIAQSNISACCNGNRKSAGGYIWRYASAE